MLNSFQAISTHTILLLVDNHNRKMYGQLIVGSYQWLIICYDKSVVHACVCAIAHLRKLFNLAIAYCLVWCMNQVPISWTEILI